MPATGKQVHQPTRGVLKIATGIFAIVLALLTLWSNPSRAEGKPKHVKQGETTRLFVMAGFTDNCSFKGFPEFQIDVQPAKGEIGFKQGEATTIQYSLSGKCVGGKVEGTGIYYTPAKGQVGEDTFTVTARIGTNEPASRTFSIIIDENGTAQ